MKAKRNKKGQFVKGSPAPKTAFKSGGHPGIEFKKGQSPWNKDTKGIMPTPWNKDTKGVMKPNSGSFKKGHKAWNKNKRENVSVKCFQCGKTFSVFPHRKDTAKFCSPECCYKSIKGRTSFMKGKHQTEKAKKKISKGVKENLPSTAFKKGQRPSVATEYKKGEKNLNWNNGSSFEPYGLKFNEELKERIRKRDNYRCQECSYTQDQLGYALSVHHIDYDKKNNEEKNLICLCRSCHSQTNFGRKDWINYFNQKVIQL